MVILLASNGKYGMESDFPIFTLPLNMNGAVSQSLEDYQWWAYSSDFKKWLAKNPKNWVADSEDMSKYTEMSKLIREHFNTTSGDYSGIVSSFNDYVSSGNEESILELEAAKASSEDIGKKTVKFHYAYNKLLSEGKLDEEYSVAEQKAGEDKAVFLAPEDPNTETSMTEAMDAYKMSPLKGGNPSSKFKLFQITDRKLLGPIPENGTGTSLVDDAVKYGVQAAAYSAGALALWTAIKYVGSAYAVRKSWKLVQGLAGKGAQGAPAPKVGINFWKRAKTAIKGPWGTIKGMATLKNTRGVVTAVKAGVKNAKYAKNLGKYGAMGVTKAFAKGATKAFSKTGSRLIPFVGEVLMVIDAVGSTWNWFSGNQAPRYGEVDTFAKETFNPKSIQIGVPITICWSQPAGSWGGTAVSFLYSNETRTTMEVVKVAEVGNKSIFILVQINSKEVQAQIAKSDVTLIAFDNSNVVERGYFDNDDLDFEMASYSQDLSSVQNYLGSCLWSEFESAYSESSDSILVSDDNAPDEYEFHFSDSDGEVINAIGKKLTTEDLSKYSDSDILSRFGVDTNISNRGKSKILSVSDKEAEAISDSLNNGFTDSFISESDKSVITKFSEFSKLNEAGGDNELTLTPLQMSTPSEVAIYMVTDKDYANPEFVGKYSPGEFTNFLLDPKDWNVENDASIDVDVNTTEILDNAKRGLFTYVKPKEKEEDIKDRVHGAEDKEGEEDKVDAGNINKPEADKIADDYYLKANPDDIEIKDRKSSTVIRDNSMTGGINLFDEILTPVDKEVLKIENWKTITFAKEMRDNRGDVIGIKLKNKYAPFGDKSRKYRAIDGEAFELAKRFVEQTKDRIKYE